MSAERANLIAAIREAPDDDVLRLASADWFEEQGDEANVARAEFIRLQIQRARLPADDVRHSELHAHELRLLKRYAPVWCGSHFVFKKVRFRRGFIEHVHLHLDQFLHHRREMLRLEPVRAITLTGWVRAPIDLIGRVAACPEWKSIETLRIHHHRDAGLGVVPLLESPHLTGLRALDARSVALDEDGRQRFERLGVLRRLRELHLPAAGCIRRPGEWLSGDEMQWASRWESLESFSCHGSLSSGELRRFTELPFWDRLTELNVPLVSERSGALGLLRGRLPRSLRGLTLRGAERVRRSDPSRLGPLFERLAQRPLRKLFLDQLRVSADDLGLLLAETSRCELQELGLMDCLIDSDLLQRVVQSPAARTLRYLGINSWSLAPDIPRTLFAEGNLGSVVHLELRTRSSDGLASALAAAPGWDRLRSLTLTGLNTASLRALLGSPKLQALNSLTVTLQEARNEPLPGLSRELANEIIQLPNLAHLRVDARYGEPPDLETLEQARELAWVSISRGKHHSTFYTSRSAQQLPPLDEVLEGQPLKHRHHEA